jgi:hypothetical protein
MINVSELFKHFRVRFVSSCCSNNVSNNSSDNSRVYTDGHPISSEGCVKMADGKLVSIEELTHILEAVNKIKSTDD